MKHGDIRVEQYLPDGKWYVIEVVELPGPYTNMRQYRFRRLAGPFDEEGDAAEVGADMHTDRMIAAAG